MGYYGEVTRDFTNCFVDKDGTDIQVSKQTADFFFEIKNCKQTADLFYIGWTLDITDCYCSSTCKYWAKGTFEGKLWSPR